MQKKIIAVQEILGKHLTEPVYEDSKEDIEESSEDEMEEKDLKQIFISSVDKVTLMNKTCNMFWECLQDFRTAKFYEKHCFKFPDDRESRLYR